MHHCVDAWVLTTMIVFPVFTIQSAPLVLTKTMFRHDIEVRVNDATMIGALSDRASL